MIILLLRSKRVSAASLGSCPWCPFSLSCCYTVNPTGEHASLLSQHHLLKEIKKRGRKGPGPGFSVPPPSPPVNAHSLVKTFYDNWE